ncbi:ABC transporter ATP-binding protein [Natronospora cellulosivora (SeqCode)]
MPGEKAKDFKGTLRRLSKYLKPYRLHLAIVILAAILANIFNILSPMIQGWAITSLWDGVVLKAEGLGGIDFEYLSRILILLAALYIFSAFFTYIQQYIMAGIVQNTVYDLREEVNHKLSRLPLRFFDENQRGEILSRVSNDIDNISSTLQQSITQLISAVITLVGVTVIMLYISPILTLIVYLTLPLYLFFTKPIILRAQKYFAAQQKNLGELNAHVEEMYTGHKIVKVFCKEEDSIEEFEEINERLFNAGWKAEFISGIVRPLMEFVNNIGYVLIAVVGAVFAVRQVITVGEIQAFVQYARQFTQPINETANIANIIQSTIASAERVFRVLDEKEEDQNYTEGISLYNPKGEVKIENLSFGYEKDIKIIENMNIDVKAGQTIAIVGPTGAGKTTLVNLLMRFYELDEGRITIDGVDIKKIKRGELRNVFAMVLQDSWLFKGTIRDNIAYGSDDASEEEIIAAAKAARADHFIRTLPEGYDMEINEESSNISQGQKQLITIARAILLDPAIMILDEATSSVDTRTEVLIQQAMDEIMEGKTSFVIAHRLSTIKNADLILVMDKGKIVEQGTHIELLEQKGFYADLYNSQFSKNKAI